MGRWVCGYLRGVFEVWERDGDERELVESMDDVDNGSCPSLVPDSEWIMF